jgi:hypothetical protein
MRTRPPPSMTAIALSASLACALLTGCADLYIVSDRVELRGDQRVPSGGGCAQVMHGSGLFASGGASSSGGSIGPDNDLQVDEGDQRDRYVVEVSSMGELLEHRSYDESFLRSQKVDTFQVTTARGRRFEFSYRGSKECDFLPPPDMPDAASATSPPGSSARAGG